jgi:hypothetical protein
VIASLDRRGLLSAKDFFDLALSKHVQAPAGKWPEKDEFDEGQEREKVHQEEG